MFWQWPARSGALSDQPWARAVALELDAGKVLPAHAAPADALLVCVAGTIRLSLEGTERELGPGDGVAMRAGQVHALAGGTHARAVLILRRGGDGA